MQFQKGEKNNKVEGNRREDEEEKGYKTKLKKNGFLTVNLKIHSGIYILFFPSLKQFLFVTHYYGCNLDCTVLQTIWNIRVSRTH